MARHNELGKRGEDIAVEYLQKQGYVIRERGWRAGHCEIDIIAITPDMLTLVFVEVKTRMSNELIAPELAVNRAKILNIARAADRYVKMHSSDEELRFDIITIVGADFKVEHIADAFNPLLLFR